MFKWNGIDVTGMYFASSQIYEDTFSEINEAIVIIDKDQNITYCNNIAAKLLEYDTPEDIIGTNGLDYVSPEQHHIMAMETETTLFTGKSNPGHLIRMIKKDGNYLSVYARYTLLELESETHIVCIARPFEFEQIDTRLLHFLQTLRHEVNIPLSAIWGMAEMMEYKHQTELMPDMVKSIQKIIENVKRLSEVSERMVSLESLKDSVYDHVVTKTPVLLPLDLQHLCVQLRDEYESCFEAKLFEAIRYHRLVDDDIVGMMEIVDLLKDHERFIRENRQELEVKLLGYRLNKFYSDDTKDGDL